MWKWKFIAWRVSISAHQANVIPMIFEPKMRFGSSKKKNIIYTTILSTLRIVCAHIVCQFKLKRGQTQDANKMFLNTFTMPLNISIEICLMGVFPSIDKKMILANQRQDKLFFSARFFFLFVSFFLSLHHLHCIEYDYFNRKNASNTNRQKQIANAIKSNYFSEWIHPFVLIIFKSLRAIIVWCIFFSRFLIWVFRQWVLQASRTIKWTKSRISINRN